MSAGALRGRRCLVVGASAGIGRAFAARAVGAGAAVSFCARRGDRLTEAVAEAGGGVAVVGDVTEPGDAERIVAESVDALGPLHLILFAAGTGAPVPLARASDEEWLRTYATNAVGFNRLARAALSHMADPAVIAALSSEIVGRPRMSMGPYGASKAALDQSLRHWRVEHPELRFCTVTVGATMPTEFGDEFGGAALGEAMTSWLRRGEMQQRFMPTDDVAGVLVGVLGSVLDHPGVAVEELRLRSPSPAAATFDEIEF